MRYAVINETTGAVENIVLWDGVSAWTPPEGCRAELLDEGDATGVDASTVERDPEQDRLLAIEATIAALAQKANIEVTTAADVAGLG